MKRINFYIDNAPWKLVTKHIWALSVKRKIWQISTVKVHMPWGALGIQIGVQAAKSHSKCTRECCHCPQQISEMKWINFYIDHAPWKLVAKHVLGPFGEKEYLGDINCQSLYALGCTWQPYRGSGSRKSFKTYSRVVLLPSADAWDEADQILIWSWTLKIDSKAHFGSFWRNPISQLMELGFRIEISTSWGAKWLHLT